MITDRLEISRVTSDDKADYCKVVPAIYGSEEEDGVYERVSDEELADKLYVI